MFQKIFAIARKELHLWLQSPGNWLVVFLVPFAFIGIFGSVFSTGTPVVTVFAVNEDQGELGAEILDQLEKSENLEFIRLETRAEADRRVGKGDRLAAVVVPPDFSQAVTTKDGASLLVIVDPGQADQAGIVTGLVQEALIKPIVFAEIERAISGLFKDKTVEAANQDLFKIFLNAGLKAVVAKSVNEAIDDPLLRIEPRPYSEQATQKEVNLLNSMVPGFALMFGFFMVSHLGGTVVQERASGTLRRLIVSPVKRGALLVGKALPFFGLALFQLAFVLALCNLVFDVPLGSSFWGLMIVLASTALVVAGMGIMVAALARSETQAGVVATLIVLAMAAVSGCLMPQINVPGINMITPHYWAMEGIQNIISRGLGVSDILPQAGVLLGMAVIYFAIGAWRFRFDR
jgi:ABC-2 type transport system permease protein